jgi:hypothetical protein
MRRAVVLIVAALWAAAAAAQVPVYRCGNSYSQEPCSQGRGVDVADPRSAQQAAQSRQAALRDAREADALERARLRAERDAARHGPALIGWSKPAGLGDPRCAKVTACKNSGASDRRPTKIHKVTLYRGAQAR